MFFSVVFWLHHVDSAPNNIQYWQKFADKSDIKSMVIYESWNFPHMRKALAWPHHFPKRIGLGPYNYFNPTTFDQSGSTKPGKWVVIYLCINFASVSTMFLLDFRTVLTVWYFRIVLTVWYFRTVLTVWYFRTVLTVWYFRTVLTVWYF